MRLAREDKHSWIGKLNSRRWKKLERGCKEIVPDLDDPGI